MARKSLSGSDFRAPVLLNGSAGSSGQVLTSQGTDSTPIWTTVSSSGLTPSSYISTGILSDNQALSSAMTDTLVAFVDYADPQNWWDASAKRLTPTIAGYYSVTFETLWSSLNSTSQTNTQIRKNGNSETIQQRSPDANNPYFFSATKIVYMNGTTDYLEFTAWSPVNTQSLQKGNALGSGTNFSVALLVAGKGDKGDKGDTGDTGPAGSDGIQLTALSAVSPIVYNNTTGQFSLDNIDGGTP